jgi:hypothetical protein
MDDANRAASHSLGLRATKNPIDNPRADDCV